MASGKLVIKPKKYRGPSQVISARIPGDLVKELDRVAEHTGYNRNEVIQLCLEYAVNQMEEEE